MQQVDSAEFGEWMAFDRQNPLPDVRMDFSFAMLTSLIANVNRDSKKRGKPYTLADFSLSRRVKRTTVATMKQIKSRIAMYMTKGKQDG